MWQHTVKYDKLRRYVLILPPYNRAMEETNLGLSLPCIKKYLLSLGFQPNLKGYHLLAKLLENAGVGEEILPLKYCGYQKLSMHFGIDVCSIEKDIQNAISAAWLRGDVDVLYKEFGETLDEDKGKPTNKQFVLTALERLSGSRYCQENISV